MLPRWRGKELATAQENVILDTADVHEKIPNTNPKKVLNLSDKFEFLTASSMLSRALIRCCGGDHRDSSFR